MNLPDTRLPIGALTAADRELLAWGMGQDVDYVALSFVRRADDVRELKELIAAAGGDQLVVAKIEKKEALAAHDEIIAAADAVMVARGDLGVEIDPATVPIWQKRIIHAANLAGKPVITATQMLQSMVASPRPTRAEASDVANAIYDATSAVMLSGETAIGCYPAEAVRTMAEIALVVEADIERQGRAPQPWAAGRTGVSGAISHGACEVAQRVGAAAIVSATFSGATARAVARHLPAQPIVAVSPNRRVVNQLALCWGVCPLLGADRGQLRGGRRRSQRPRSGQRLRAARSGGRGHRRPADQPFRQDQPHQGARARLRALVRAAPSGRRPGRRRQGAAAADGRQTVRIV